MNTQRRDVLKAGGGATMLALLAAAGWLKPGDALAADAWNKAAFDTKTLDETVKALGGGAPAQSKDITFFQTPDIAENGAVVPVG
ncbi:MAG: thiosulfate oxidation carrier protein SoxY, partial [Betaproteobacteria bacterium]